MENKCAAKVWSSDHWHTYNCSKKATITEDGKQWCATHAPSKVAARLEKRQEKWAKQDKALRAKWDVERAHKTVADTAILDPTDSEAIKLAVQRYKEAVGRICD